MQLIDSHCHFDFEDFAGDRDQVWRDCLEVGVQQLVIPGVSISQWQPLQELAATQRGWHAAIGVHPWWVAELSGSPDGLTELIVEHASRQGCVAVGECGLDAGIDTDLELQLAVFRAQALAARELELPLIVHSHKTHSQVLALLKELRPPRGGVLHAFSGSEEIAREYWKLGFYLGVGGTITYERAAKTRRTVTAMPLEALVLESDAPDMPLAGRQGQRNSPAYLPLIAEALAGLRDVPVEDIAQQTSGNTKQLFAL